MKNKTFSAIFVLALIVSATALVFSNNVGSAQSTKPIYHFSGHVYDSNGNPASGAYTYLIDTSIGRGAASGYADSSGFYNLAVPAGTYNLVSGLTGTSQSYSQNNIVINGDMTKNFNLVVCYKISGHVYNSIGQAVSGAATNAYNATWTLRSATSDGSGYYAIYAPAGTYTFGLWPPANSNYINYVNSSFTVTSDMTYDVVLSTGYRLSGYIYYTSNEKVINATTYLINGAGTSFSSGRYTDPLVGSGAYSLAVPPGNYTLQSKLNGVLVYSEPNVTITGDTSKDLTLISVSTSPQSVVMDVGQSYAYTATAIGGSGNYSKYVWYVNEVAKAITNNPTFYFLPEEAGTYTISASAIDSCGANSVQSTTVSATVNPALVPPSLSVSPSMLDQGQTCILTATEASAGTGSYTYQWYIKAPSATVYSPINGATALSYTFTTTRQTETGKWSFLLNVTDSASDPNTVPSKALSLWVNPPPTVVVTPELAVLDEGSTKTFTAIPSGGSGSYTYEWFLDSAKVGANSSSYPYVAAAGIHIVYVKVTDSASPPLSAVSIPIAVTTNPPLVAPTATAVNSTIDQGQPLNLTATAPLNGTLPYAYQWFASAPNGTYSALAGATSANCSIPTANNITAGVWYFVLHVTDSATTPVTVSSNVIIVTINTAPTVSIAPVNAAFTLGQSSTFTASATGGSGSYISYQWYVNGTAQAGQTGATFSYSPPSTGICTVTASVTDSLGATSSQSVAAQVQVSPVPTPAPTPTPTATPTTKPTNQPTNTPSPTQNPTATPASTSPTPTQNITNGPDTGTYVLISIVLVLVVVSLIGYILLLRVKKSKKN